MWRIAFLLFVCAVVFCLAAVPSDATCRRVQAVSYGYSNQSYGHSGYGYQSSYYAPIYYPVYTIGNYTDNGNLKEEILKLKLEVKDQKIQFLEYKFQQLQKGIQQGTPPPGALGQEQAGKHVLAFNKYCARCHDELNAQKKGDGFVLFKAGRLDHLTLVDLISIKSEIELGKMPKDGAKIGQEEYDAMNTWLLTEMKAKAGK